MTHYDSMHEAFRRMAGAATSETISREEFLTRIASFEQAFKIWKGGIPECAWDPAVVEAFPLGCCVMYDNDPQRLGNVIGYELVRIPEKKPRTEVRVRWRATSGVSQLMIQSRKFRRVA